MLEIQKMLKEIAMEKTKAYLNHHKIDAVDIQKCRVENPFPTGVNNFYAVYCGRDVNWNIYQKMLDFLQKKGF
ncbi:hypothetical protein [Aureispira sp. CCB-E]|uniref:hypothetical protein n=1 Tax=Aureispira sp. CCB-E TaxID=3051121 RepID=UPI0028686D09|nr:hypothetical protein [Aureispira sp. CCB-E]WMX16568.1 hypothetical protein QP953_09330 [Aureispira sp. CCB-E]